MKITAVLLFGTIATVYGALPRTPLHGHRLSIFTPRVDPPQCPSGGGNVCSADCSGIIICQDGQPVGQVNCAVQTQNTRPYCNKDTLACDSTPDSCQTSTSGKCLFKGFYPDILKCKIYYQCDEVGDDKTPIPYTCGGNTVYNPNTELCQAGLQCYQFSNNELCRGKTNQWVVHPIGKKFYVFCAEKGPILNKCKGSECPNDQSCAGEDIYEFVPTLGSCEYVCKKSGRFINLYDTSKQSYYECVPSGNSFIKTLQKCPKGYIFDDKKHVCVKPSN